MIKNKYQIIYADPPWSYRDKRKRKEGGDICGGALTYYKTLTMKELKELPIHKLADENCMLFMWATFPNLQEALDTMAAWGFKYKTLGFSWIKLNKKNKKPFFGIGYYTKSNCEVCLIGVKGKPIKESNSVSSVVLETIGEHSTKPDIVRDKIVQLCGDVPRIELFARKDTKGWDSIGMDLDGQDIVRALDYDA